MYQYISDDMSALKRFRIVSSPFTAKPSPPPVLKHNVPPAPVQQAGSVVTATVPVQGTSSLALVTNTSGDVKDVAPTAMMPEHLAKEKTGMTPAAEDEGEYPDTPDGFARKVTRHFVLYEEGAEVSKELEENMEALHGNIMLDLVAFSPWTREKKVYIFYASSPQTYRKLTGRPTWSGGAASLSERKIYVYRSDEAFGILAHELTHIYFDSFFTAASPSPLWLSEGVATYIQAERGFSTPNWLAQNLKLLEGGSGFKLGDLVRIENLQGADEDNVRLWYAQSYSVVRFLMRLKAGDAFYVFCKGLRDGKPAAQSMYQAYGMPYNKLSSLEYAWRYDLKTGKISGVQR
jgi:hypothetical protein